MYAKITVNAGEKIIFSVEAQSNEELFSDLAEVEIYAPSAGK